MLLKALIVGLLIAIAEVINGNIRVRFLHTRFGKKRAKLISFISGVVFIIVISWATLGWINPANYEDCFYVGLTWLLIMLCLDIYFGKQVFKLKWTQVLDDFNPMKGNLLSIGMIFLLLCPSIMFWLS
jgi:predicted acyltransferase